MLPRPMRPINGDVESKHFDLKLGSPVLYFENPRCGWYYTPGKVFIKNPTKNRYTFKVKCTNNQMFDIKEPVGFVEAEESVDVEVFHCPGFFIPENDSQHLSVYYIKCDKEAKDYGPIWRSKKAEGCKHVHIRFPKQVIMTVEQKKSWDAKIKEERRVERALKAVARKEEEELDKERKALLLKEKEDVAAEKKKEEEERKKEKDEKKAK